MPFPSKQPVAPAGDKPGLKLPTVPARDKPAMEQPTDKPEGLDDIFSGYSTPKKRTPPEPSQQPQPGMPGDPAQPGAPMGGEWKEAFKKHLTAYCAQTDQELTAEYVSAVLKYLSLGEASLKQLSKVLKLTEEDAAALQTGFPEKRPFLTPMEARALWDRERHGQIWVDGKFYHQVLPAKAEVLEGKPGKIEAAVSALKKINPDVNITVRSMEKTKPAEVSASLDLMVRTMRKHSELGFMFSKVPARIVITEELSDVPSFTFSEQAFQQRVKTGYTFTAPMFIHTLGAAYVKTVVPDTSLKAMFEKDGKPVNRVSCKAQESNTAAATEALLFVLYVENGKGILEEHMPDLAEFIETTFTEVLEVAP